MLTTGFLSSSSIRLGLRLGLFQLSFGNLDVLGLGLLNPVLTEQIGTIRTARGGSVLAVAALSLMLLAAPGQSLGLLKSAITLFGVSLGICINACLTLMFSFVEPGQTGFLLGVWDVEFAYSCGLTTITGGGVLTVLKTFSGGNTAASYSGFSCRRFSVFLQRQ